MTLKKNLTGKQFGKLTVKYRHSTTRNGHIRWHCECECGGSKNILSTHLIQGLINSCGCLQQRKNSDHPNWSGYGNISGHHYQLLKHAASGKTRKEILFEVSIKYLSDLYDLQNGKCALTGIPLFILGSDAARTASLDRIDNTKGYIEGNVQWVHKDINMMKNKLDEDYFIELCKKVAENN